MARKKKESVDETKSEVKKVELDLIADAAGEDGYKIKESQENSSVAKRNVLNEIVDAIFRDKSYIESMTEQQASQNLFMVLRRIAIKYPIRANLLNKSKVNAKDVIKFLSQWLYEPSGVKPSWVYTSGAKKEQEKKDATSSISKADIKDYIDYNGINRKDFESAMKLFPEELIEDVKEHVSYFKKINSSKIQ